MIVTFITAGLVFSAAAHAVAALFLTVEHLFRRLPFDLGWPLVSAALGGVALSLAAAQQPMAIALAGVVMAAASVAAVRLFRDLRPTGVLLIATFVGLACFGLGWSMHFIATMPVSDVTRTLFMATAALALVVAPSALVQNFESWEVLTRRRWRRPHGRRPASPGFAPLVEVQVPTHNEPPEVVCETLDRLAAVEYPNFEVLVIDNNTEDPAMWEPLERHCRSLGPRFRFLHVEGITGAKAGALNHLLAEHTNPDAELIAVVDADYHVEPDWLTAVVGHFEDPGVGFVQTPHAYRDWHGSAYQRMCAWEYAFFFHTTMRSLNEHRAALTVGTMCVIRRRALQEAGGWAEWCLTEDSELAIRIHALGYSSVYLTEVFGRGLIPETFAGYRKQRFRWTYGPIQELKVHARLFLFGRWRRRSELSIAQRIHHGNHGLDRATIGMSFLALPLLAATAGSMVVHGEAVQVPLALWIAATVLLLATLLLRYLVYRVAVGASLREALGGMLAAAALSHVITVASVLGVIGRKARWRRTDKFRARSRGFAALAHASTESALAGVCSVVAGLLLTLGSGGMTTMVAIGFAMTATSYLAAPILALIADRDVRRSRAREALVSAAADALAGPAEVVPEWIAGTARRDPAESAQRPPVGHGESTPRRKGQAIRGHATL